MSNNKQSSIGLLITILGNYDEELLFIFREQIKQVKAMHKEEIMNASEAGFDDGSGFIEDIKYKNPEQYASFNGNVECACSSEEYFNETILGGNKGVEIVQGGFCTTNKGNNE